MADDVIDVETLRRLLALDPETGELTWLPRPREMFPNLRSCNLWQSLYAGKPALITVDERGYRHGSVMRRPFLAHRVVWAIANGFWPCGTIDHINGDKTDNRPSNLRDVPLRENAKNRPIQRNNTSGVQGVSWDKWAGKWSATIRVAGKRLHLGKYAGIGAAVAARRAAELKYGFHENHGRKA